MKQISNIRIEMHGPTSGTDTITVEYLVTDSTDPRLQAVVAVPMYKDANIAALCKNIWAAIVKDINAAEGL